MHEEDLPLDDSTNEFGKSQKQKNIRKKLSTQVTSLLNGGFTSVWSYKTNILEDNNDIDVASQYI